MAPTQAQSSVDDYVKIGLGVMQCKIQMSGTTILRLCKTANTEGNSNRLTIHKIRFYCYFTVRY